MRSWDEILSACLRHTEMNRILHVPLTVTAVLSFKFRRPIEFRIVFHRYTRIGTFLVDVKLQTYCTTVTFRFAMGPV